MDKETLEILKSIQTSIADIQNDIKDLKTQTTENTQILKALEHSSEVNKAEHDNISNDIAKIGGDVTRIRKDLSFVEQATAKKLERYSRIKSS